MEPRPGPRLMIAVREFVNCPDALRDGLEKGVGIAMSFCIFCDAELTKATKPEHVLLSALGGRRTTKRAICSVHNNTFGGTIDKAIADQVPIIRNLMQFASGTGKPPPALRNVQAQGEVINIGSDGRPELLAKPFEVIDLGEGRFNLNINVSSEEELRSVIPHIAARLKMPEEELWKQLGAIEGRVVYRRPNPVHFRLSFGGPDALRSVAKACLVLLASKIGTDSLRESPFADARRFVLSGDERFNLSRSSLDARPLPGLAQFQAGYGSFFNLIYVKSDAAGRTVGHFTLYNLVAWQVVLAEAAGPPNLRVGLVSNPLNPSEWSDTIADDVDIDVEWLNSPDRSNLSERGQERFAAAMQHYVETSRELETGRIIDDVLKRRLLPGQALDMSQEETRLALAEISARFAHMVANIPLQEPLKVTPPQPKAESGEVE